MDAMTDRISRRLWPAGLTRVPYWVYTEKDVLAAEQKRIFEGPVWNYLCLEIDLPNVGDYRTTLLAACPSSWCAPRMVSSVHSKTAARIAAR